MTIEFKPVAQPTTPVTYRYHYCINGEVLGFYSRDELLVLKDAALSDLKMSVGWLPDDLIQETRQYLAAINKALEDAVA